MTKFRPCIDLHNGKVKQIVGGTLSDDGVVKENFVSNRDATYFADLYAKDKLLGGHVIQLGGGNEAAALRSLSAYPNGLQIGGGVNLENAQKWLEAGASHVIVTSWLFEGERFSWRRLEELVEKVGRERLVLDLSCRKTTEGWSVAMNRWQTLTDLEITPENLEKLALYCDEFLIHAADVEGLCGGIDSDLVEVLGNWGGISMTYAGGVSGFEDLELIERVGLGKVDVTVGSALDIFGGELLTYSALVEWNNRVEAAK